MPIPVEPVAPEAECHQLTVLFCDLMESTALAGQLDPEVLREVVQAYQAACAEVIQRYDGHIAQYLGDGLLVYFGYPQAHEDDAQRAIHTGLGMVEAIVALNSHLAQSKGIQLAVRVGIHTGLVVVGEMGGEGRQERLALGETPNVAARLQGIAAPDTVVASVATLRLAQGLFSAEDLGSHVLKGVAMPIQVYRVRGESRAPSRLDGAVTRGLTALVGRELEVTLLLERWAQVQEGIGQVVWLSGEPGIGKSRLVGVLKDHVAEQPHTRLECRCSPYHQHSALYPVIDLLQRALAFASEETSDDKVRKLEGALTSAHIDLQESVPLLTALLSLALPERYEPLALTPQRQRQRTLETLLAVILELASQHPVLFIVKDLHWIDPSTLEFLTLLVDQGPTARIFTLFTSRPDFRSPWGTRAHLTQLTLNRLPRRLGEIMVERVARGKALPSAVVQQVVDKTDGVPLFMEELTKMVLESGLLREAEGRYELTGPLPPLAIPTTLHDSLMARLDRLAAVKEVAQLGATLGRTFSYALLRAVSRLDEVTLQQALSRLVEAELLYQRGVPPRATYIFKHALIQVAAYQALLKSTRQRHHQQVARVLEERFPEIAGVEPELLAHHYMEAELLVQAIPYWQCAGELTKSREALTLAHELAHPISQAVTLDYTAMLYQFRREEHAAQEQVERAVAICTEQGFAYYLAWVVIIQGWALSARGQLEEGMTQMRRGVAALRATGAGVRCPYYLGQLADACGKAGQAEEGLFIVDEALALVHKTGERWPEAEIHRFRGELLLVQVVAAGFKPTLTQEVETCFRQALEVARRQQAKSLELRAATSLCRLWQQQGKWDEARELLAPIYGWFTEGFDTVDLQEAKALLQELG
ncbi:MAG: ATP-binding protein [Candidatus Entotheonellia bacterium]